MFDNGSFLRRRKRFKAQAKSGESKNDNQDDDEEFYITDDEDESNLDDSTSKSVKTDKQSDELDEKPIQNSNNKRVASSSFTIDSLIGKSNMSAKRARLDDTKISYPNSINASNGNLSSTSSSGSDSSRCLSPIEQTQLTNSPQSPNQTSNNFIPSTYFNPSFLPNFYQQQQQKNFSHISSSPLVVNNFYRMLNEAMLLRFASATAQQQQQQVNQFLNNVNPVSIILQNNNINNSQINSNQQQHQLKKNENLLPLFLPLNS